MVNLYRRGRIAEKKVELSKEKRVRNIGRSRGSRGPADIYAKKGNKTVPYPSMEVYPLREKKLQD